MYLRGVYLASEVDIKALRNKLKAQVKKKLETSSNDFVTTDYATFKKSYFPKKLSLYEKAANYSEKILNVKVENKQKLVYQKYIDTCHLGITPNGAMSFAFLVPIIFLLTILILTMGIPLLNGGTPSLFFLLVAIFIAAVSLIPLQRIPMLLANNWRMNASNQMVLAVFYVVSYMRHTSNLELAVDFAAEHLDPPLSLDLKKVIWDLETGTFGSLKESLDNYLNTWNETNQEFVEAMHLIESSLYETSDDRRVGALDKSLSIMLEETFEKMLHFAQDLKGPLTTLHMLGIVLPILGLVVLPLMVSFVPEIKWYHIATLYNIIIPVSVYYLGRVLLSKRPTGYGETDMENLPHQKKFSKVILKFGKTEAYISPAAISIFLFMIFAFLGTLPLLIHAVDPEFDIVMTQDFRITHIKNIEDTDQIRDYFLHYKMKEDFETGIVTEEGPFGIGATLLSIVLIFGIGFSYGLYNKLKTQNLIKIRESSKKLEKEFSGALFQLGNRLGDGLPAEIAFSKVANVMTNSTTANFFRTVSNNIQKLGLNLKDAIFDRRKGALSYYPSNMIESSMKVLIESSRKGSLVASKALINVSDYIKQIRRVDERLKDLMADVISSMQSQIAFLTPAIAGIVVGITSMIGNILGSINEELTDALAQTSDAALPNLLEGLSGGLPAYYFQIVVGLYVVQIGIILSILVNGILNGADSLNEKYIIGKNVMSSTILYCIIAFIVIVIFNYISAGIVSGIS